MHRLLILTASAIILLALLASCPNSTPPAPPSTDYGSNDSGSSIELAVGDSFTIGLFAAPSTAFLWQIEELDESVVQHISNEFVPDPQTKDQAGGGGTDIWTFKVVAPGTTELRMLNARPTDPQEVNGDFTLTIVVAE